MQGHYTKSSVSYLQLHLVHTACNAVLSCHFICPCAEYVASFVAYDGQLYALRHLLNAFVSLLLMVHAVLTLAVKVWLCGYDPHRGRPPKLYR